MLSDPPTLQIPLAALGLHGAHTKPHLQAVATTFGPSLGISHGQSATHTQTRGTRHVPMHRLLHHSLLGFILLFMPPLLQLMSPSTLIVKEQATCMQ